MPDLYGKKAWVVIGVLNYTDCVLIINASELAGYNTTTVSALYTYNQIMGRLVNATGG